MALDFAPSSIVYDPGVMDLIDHVPRVIIAIQVLSNKARTGWVNRGIKEWDAETIWQHTEDLYQDLRYFPVEKFGLDRELMAQMVFCHDLVPETYGPDWPPHLISPEDKKSEELRAAYRLERVLGEGSETLVDYWQLYDAKVIPEAKIVGQLDKINCVVRAMCELERGIDAREFFETAREKVKEPFLQWVMLKLENSYGFDPDPRALFHRLLDSHEEFEMSCADYKQSGSKLSYLEFAHAESPPDEVVRPIDAGFWLKLPVAGQRQNFEIT